MKWLSETLQPLFTFLKWCCVEKGWKPTVMLFTMIAILLSATAGTIYIFSLKYAIPPDNPKYVVEKPKSILPDYIEYKDRTLFEIKAEQSK